MPNDDLGQFPTPTGSGDQPTTTPPSDTSLMDDINTPATDKISDEPFTTPPQVDAPTETNPAFEETPDEIPSVTQPTIEPPIDSPIETPVETPAYTPPSAPASQIYPTVSAEPTPVTPPVAPTPPSYEETPAMIVPKGGSAFGSLISIVLLLISGIAIAATVFLFSQSQQLKQQLLEITQTLEKQQTTITPTPTPTIIEFTTPTITPEATPTATISLTPTPTASVSAETALPLSNAANALKVAINHQPNAQLILIKTENATTPQFAITKYFFRQDLTTKKYFYVMIENGKNPEIVDKSIFVTPDNNIPSLNDLVLGNKLGIDLDIAVKIAYDACTSGLCKTANVKAQYIKVGDSLIWQITFTPQDTSKQPLVIQINAESRVVLYKSTGF